MTKGAVTRRAFLACSAAAVAALTLRAIRKHPPSDALAPAAPNPLAAANDLFFLGDFNNAHAAFLTLSSNRIITADDCARSCALCSMHLDDPARAITELATITSPSTDDRRLLVLLNVKTQQFDNAMTAFGQIPMPETACDVPLLEQLANASAAANNRPQAWRFYHQVEQADPYGAALERLSNGTQFQFSGDFFGYDPTSITNYARGAAGGAKAWTLDSEQGVTHFLRHPVDSVTSVAQGLRQLFSTENVKLLLSPRLLVARLGSTAAMIYWSAWETCRVSVARENDLNLDDFADQRAINEMAAGRMLGYVAPELVAMILKTAAGAEEVEAVSTAVQTQQILMAAAHAEYAAKEVNLRGRSGQFLVDSEKFPALSSINWLTEATWGELKQSEELRGQLNRIVTLMSDIRYAPGAQLLVQSLAASTDSPHTKALLFQLERAAAYAKQHQLIAIGRPFHVEIALPGRPVQSTRGEANLELNDGTVIETEFRDSPLVLDEKLKLMLIKLDRAIAIGGFKRARIECNVGVAPELRQYCAGLHSRIEVAAAVGGG